MRDLTGFITGALINDDYGSLELSRFFPPGLLDDTFMVPVNFYECDYPSPVGMVVGARVGVSRGDSVISIGGGSLRMGEGFLVRVQIRIVVL